MIAGSTLQANTSKDFAAKLAWQHGGPTSAHVGHAMEYHHVYESSTKSAYFQDKLEAKNHEVLYLESRDKRQDGDGKLPDRSKIRELYWQKTIRIVRRKTLRVRLPRVPGATT